MTENLPVEKQKMESLKTLFEKCKGNIAALLPKHLTPERIIKITLSAASRNPRLIECSGQSILKSILLCSEMGLEPSGALGGAHLVPYKNGKTGRYEAQAIPDYRGLMDLARRSGEITTIDSACVYEKDFFEYEKGLNPKLIHKPSISGERGKIIGAYSVTKFKDGGYQVEFMTRDELDAVKNRSRASSSGPWQTDFDQMCRKTVIRRNLKYCPKSAQLVKALEAENVIEQDLRQETILDINLPDELKEPETTQAADIINNGILKEKENV
jgi:recombination protein RecT